MKKNIHNFSSCLFDCHMHFGIMLSSFFNDKLPSCQNIQGIIEKLMIPPINTGIVFPFPNDFIGNEVLDDVENNRIVRHIFENVPYMISNERLIREIEQTEQFNLLPFLMFSLKYGIEEQIDFLEECVENHYIYGLKYYADSDNLNLKDFSINAKPFIKFMLKHDLPITFHVSGGTVTNNQGVSSPIDLIKLAVEYPELRICIAHCAHFSKKVFSQLEAMKLKNVFIDTSPFLHLCNVRKVFYSNNCLDFKYDKPIDVLNEIINMLPENIIWGSDYPFNFTCNLDSNNQDKSYLPYSYEANISLLTSLSQDNQNLITHCNPLKYLFG